MPAAYPSFNPEAWDDSPTPQQGAQVPCAVAWPDPAGTEDHQSDLPLGAPAE